ncbi:NnrS family protein [Pseudomonas sp. GD03721]|nr:MULTISPECIES: NnrS family protein [unclassified Pseudomonas]MDH1444141.1 NnrS family protein [Pseudomonas sp. GD03722]WGG00880.1 NnrS family protein [Pseudomonas sp. GD03721]WGG05048.1 NnrS family protein [Pseudomonas sp. GD03919]
MQLLDRKRALAIAPFWRLGFRPFFVAGALFALLAVALWAAVLHGLTSPAVPGGMLAWHRHEMPFGFGLAIIAGFLLTAVQNWTGRPGLSGRPLIALFGLWLAARLVWFIPVPLALLIALQLAFIGLFIAQMARQLIAARQRNNYPILLVLSLLTLCQSLTLAGLALGDDSLQRRGALAALWLIAVMLSLIGGRVIPFFTQRGLGRVEAFAAHPWLDRLLLVCGVLVAALFASGHNLQASPSLAGPFIVLSVLHGLRLWRWHLRGVWRVPLLWSLHLGYAWLLIATLGMAAWHLGWLAQPSLASHALAVGAMGGLILAMMARVSLGHTGRALQPPQAMAWAFGLLNLGALIRVSAGSSGLWLAALCWAVAFALFAWYYAPLLCRARVDGHPG